MSSELEDRLRVDMERFTRDIHLPPSLALKACRHNQKRRATVRAAAASGAAVAITAGAVAAAGAAGAFGSMPANQASGPRPAATSTTGSQTAYVVARIEQALAPASVGNLISNSRTVFPRGFALEPVPGGMAGPQGSKTASAEWKVSYLVQRAYGGTERYSAFTASGRYVFDLGITLRNGTATATAVLYGSRTWWTATGGSSSGGRPGCVQGGTIRLSAGPGNGWPAFIRSQLACGAYSVIGRQVVGGIDTIKIAGPYGFALWVNPETYLPVQLAIGPTRDYFQWLPATQANLDLLKVSIPAGFKQVAPPERP